MMLKRDRSLAPSTTTTNTANYSHEPNNFTPVRLLLASLVMLFHFDILTGKNSGIWPLVYPDFAVEGFYVISGFLIYESFDRMPEPNGFFIRRFFRLYPLYVLMICAQALVLLLLQREGIGYHLREAIYYVAVNSVFLNFLQNSIGDVLTGLPDAGINPSLWTLKIEVAFYALVPFIWLGVQRFRTRWLVGVFAIALLYTTVLRLTGHFLLAKQLPGAMMYFTAGILICIHRRSVHVPPLAAGLAALIGIAGVTCIQMGIGPFAAEPWRILFPFMVVPVIYFLVFSLPPLGMRRDISYGVYLIHGPVIQTLIAMSVIQFSAGSLAAVVSIVFLLGLAAERFIERPFIRLGHVMSKSWRPFQVFSRSA